MTCTPMIRRFLAPALIAAAIGSLPSVAAANCPGWDRDDPHYDPNYYSASTEYRRATYVAIVRVTREAWLDDQGKPKPLKGPFQNGASRPWGFDDYSGAFYNVTVVKAFKGKPARHLVLYSNNSTARFTMVVGKTYLAFIQPVDTEFNGPQVGIDNCGNSDFLSRARRALRTVAALSSKSHR